MATSLSTPPHPALRADLPGKRGGEKSRNLTLALIVIAFAQLMVVLDTTIVNVALPSIQRALSFSATDLEWVVNGYALAFGGLLLLGGRAGDLFGRRRMFIAGVLLFAAGSFAGGLATTSTWLIVARVVQGAGGAIVAPTALSLIADTFQEGAARNRALGIYAGAAGGGGAVGLILGGLIVNYLSWRWVLFVNVPIALVLAFAAPRVLAVSDGRSGRLDLPGAISVTSAMTLLVYGLSRAATQGAGPDGRLTARKLAGGDARLERQRDRRDARLWRRAAGALHIDRAPQRATPHAVANLCEPEPHRRLPAEDGGGGDDALRPLLFDPGRAERAGLQPAPGRLRILAARRRGRHHGPGHLARGRTHRSESADHRRRARGGGWPRVAVSHIRSR